MKACHPSEEVAEQTTVQGSWLTLSSSSNVWASFGEIYSDTIWLYGSWRLCTSKVNNFCKESWLAHFKQIKTILLCNRCTFQSTTVANYS